jgi:hypothetical protein
LSLPLLLEHVSLRQHRVDFAIWQAMPAIPYN